MKLRPYQVSGKGMINEAWEYHDIIFYVLATGGGKTVQFIDLMRDWILSNKRVWLIAHREELIRQAWDEAYENKIYAGIIKGDVKTDYSLPCQVMSIQTVMRRSNLPPDPHLIIIDEGHHVTEENGYGRLLQKYPNAKVLIVSATPYRLSGEGFRNIVKGKETKLIINSTIKTLIEDGWLCPLRYFLASIPDLSNASLSKGDYKEDDSEKAMEMAPIVESYKKHANGLQGVCFAVNVSHSIKIAGQYWREGIPAAHLDANTPDDERKKIIDDFKAGLIKVVCNVGIFTEGTDFPNCQFVQLACPTKSLSKYLQMVGRGTRALKGILDNLNTAEERRAAIANSDKPHAIILDNAGCYLDHRLPDVDRNWEHYFNGWKQDKKKPVITDEIEIEVFVVKDSAGNLFKTKSIKEVEGLELVEVTKEVRKKVVNITALREFDRLYKMFSNSTKVSAPGRLALNKYIEYCNRENILMVPAIWVYLRKKLILEVEERKHNVIKNREINPSLYPDELYNKTIENIEKSGVTEQYLGGKNKDYYQANEKQIFEYIMKDK